MDTRCMKNEWEIAISFSNEENEFFNCCFLILKTGGRINIVDTLLCFIVGYMWFTCLQRPNKLTIFRNFFKSQVEQKKYTVHVF